MKGCPYSWQPAQLSTTPCDAVGQVRPQEGIGMTMLGPSNLAASLRRVDIDTDALALCENDSCNY